MLRLAPHPFPPRLACATGALLVAFHLGAPSRASGCATDDWECIANEQAAAVTAKWNEVWGEGGLEDQIGDLKTEIEAFAGDVEDVLKQFEATANAFAASPLAFNNELVRRVKDGKVLADYFVGTENARLVAFIEPGGCNPATCEPFREQVGGLLLQLQSFLDLQGQIVMLLSQLGEEETPAFVPKVDLSILAELVSGTATRPGIPGVLLFPLYEILSTFIEVQESASAPLGFASECAGGDRACLAIAAFNEQIALLQETAREAVGGLLGTGAPAWENASLGFSPEAQDDEQLSLLCPERVTKYHRLDGDVRDHKWDADSVGKKIVAFYLVSASVNSVAEFLDALRIRQNIVKSYNVGAAIAASIGVYVNPNAIVGFPIKLLKIASELSLESAKFFRRYHDSCRRRLNDALIMCNVIEAGNAQVNLERQLKQRESPSDQTRPLTYEGCERAVKNGRYLDVIF